MRLRAVAVEDRPRRSRSARPSLPCRRRGQATEYFDRAGCPSRSLGRSVRDDVDRLHELTIHLALPELSRFGRRLAGGGDADRFRRWTAAPGYEASALD